MEALEPKALWRSDLATSVALAQEEGGAVRIMPV